MPVSTSSRSSSVAPGPSLQRGRACNTCRKRKIRCDGQKPTCSQCIKSSRPGDKCEYNELGKTRTQILEETVAKLQSKIRELEEPTDRSAIPLHDPYSIARRNSTPEIFSDTSGPSSPSSLSSIDRTQEELPMNVRHILLDTFLAYASMFGFFLSESRFRHSVLTSSPLDSTPRPATALLYAVYLWGANISKLEDLKKNEPLFLRKSLQHLSTSLNDPSVDPIHIIQTEILLFNYYSRQDKSLEADVHLSAAVSLTLNFQLHQVRAPFTSPLYLDHHDDHVQEGEMIRAFWTVYHLNCVASKPGSVTNMAFDPFYGAQVNTVWPLTIEEYEQNQMLETLPGHLAIQNFWNNAPEDFPGEFSQFSMLCKSTFLYHQARNVVHRIKNMRPNEQVDSEFVYIDQLIQRFRDNLPPTEQFSLVPMAERRNMSLTHCIAHAAAIELHYPFIETDTNSLENTISAAHAIQNVLLAVDIEKFVHVCHFVASTWALMCRASITELSRTRGLRSMWSPEEYNANESKLMTMLKDGFSALSFFSRDSPRSARELRELQEMFNTIVAA